MKICDVTQSYTKTSGGVRSYLDEKRKFIEKNTDWEHVLIVPGEKDSVFAEDRLTVHTVASPFIPGCEPYRVVLRVKHIISLLNRERPDIIELGCAYTLPWAAFHHRQHNPCRVVGFYHTDFPSTYVETVIGGMFGKGAALRARLLATQYARFMYNKCDRVLVPSQPLRARLARSGFKHVDYTPLGVDTELFSPVRRSPVLREELGITDDQLMLVYAGRFDSEKRIHVLVEAMAHLPEDIPARLVLAGDGPMRKQLQESASQNNRITIIPYISDKISLAAFLASGDIYVTAGPHETFGLSVLEAQSCGLPVVGVRAGALIDRVSPSLGILGEPDNVVQMAENIVGISRNGFREMGRNARAEVEAEYTWDKAFERIFNLYRSV